MDLQKEGKMSTKTHRGWVASLSNGETIFQTDEVPGEPTPWRKLVERCAEEDLWLTQIQLQLGGQTFVGIRNADGYCYFRDYEKTGIFSGNFKEKHHIGIGSVVGGTVYCTRIDEQLQSQQDSRTLASMSLHCILKPASPPTEIL